MKTYQAMLCLCLLLNPMLAIGQTASSAQISHNVAAEAKPWTSLDFNNDDSLIRFAVTSDNAGGPRPGIYAEAIHKLNLMQPDFVISTGDLIEGYEDTADLLNAQWEKFMGDLGKLEVPFFSVPGNHDHGKPLWHEVYTKRFGVTYYHFIHKDALFLCLDSNDSPEKGTGMGQEQADYAIKTLKEHENVRWTFLFQHKPLWNDKNEENWKRIEAALNGRKCTVFSGHTHNYLCQERNGITFITQSTTGGGNPLRGPEYGEVDQFAWVTLGKNGPVIASLLLDGILDKDFRTPEKAMARADFSRNRVISCSPILTEKSMFTSGNSQVKVANPTDQPMRCRILIESSTRLQVLPVSLSATIPPKSDKIFNLLVTTNGEPLPVSETQPVVLHWQAWLDSADNTGSEEFQGEQRILIDAPFKLEKLESPITVDGSIADWKRLPYEVSQPGEVWHNVPAWKGVTDSSFRFGAAYDDQFLYVAIQTQDDEPCFDGWKYWEDFALIWVDGKAGEKLGDKETFFNLPVGPKITAEQADEYTEGKMPEGIQTASRATGDGFEAEAAIPLSFLKSIQGDDWKKVRLNIGFSDFDTRDARDGVTILHWRPQWKNPASYPESGIFTR